MISLEQVADGSTADRNFQKLQGLVIDTGGVSLNARWGVQPIVFALGAAGPLAVTHGLGRTPIAVFTQTQNPLWEYAVTALAATTFTVYGFNTAGILAFNGTLNFYWLAIG